MEEKMTNTERVKELLRQIKIDNTKYEQPEMIVNIVSRMEKALTEITGGASVDSWYGEIARDALRGEHE